MCVCVCLCLNKCFSFEQWNRSPCAWDTNDLFAGCPELRLYFDLINHNFPHHISLMVNSSCCAGKGQRWKGRRKPYLGFCIPKYLHLKATHSCALRSQKCVRRQANSPPLPPLVTMTMISVTLERCEFGTANHRQKCLRLTQHLFIRAEHSFSREPLWCSG